VDKVDLDVTRDGLIIEDIMSLGLEPEFVYIILLNPNFQNNAEVYFMENMENFVNMLRIVCPYRDSISILINKEGTNRLLKNFELRGVKSYDYLAKRIIESTVDIEAASDSFKLWWLLI
jgi:hypothetical protein